MKLNRKEQYIDEEIDDEDNPEWTAEDFKNAISFSELPEDLQIILNGIGNNKPKKHSKTQNLGATIL